MLEIFTIANCTRCEAVKFAFKSHHIYYEEKDGNFYAYLHEGWRSDGSVEFRAILELQNQEFPVFRYNGLFFSYEAMMKKLNLPVLHCDGKTCTLESCDLG